MRDRTDLHWKRTQQGLALFVGHSKTPALHVLPDAVWPGMWRVWFRDGGCSDLANISRACDAASRIALAEANAPEGGIRPVGPPPVSPAAKNDPPWPAAETATWRAGS